MLQVAGLVLPLFSLVLLGYLSGKLKKLPLEGLAWLNFFLVYIALPALFFQLLASTPVEEFTRGSFLLATTSGTLLIFALCFCLARFIRKSTTKIATIQGFSGAYGNIGYMGPPLAIAAFGPEAGVPVALIFCLDNAMHFILAPTLMAMGADKPQPVIKLIFGILSKILTHPFILATIVGITAAWYQYVPPAPINQLLQSAANAAAPCALFAMGVTAALRPLKRIPTELGYLVPIKLCLHPLLVYLLVTRIPDIDTLWVQVAVLMAALPSATNVFVIAQQYRVWEERASSSVVISTLVSVVTITAYLYIAKHGWL